MSSAPKVDLFTICRGAGVYSDHQLKPCAGRDKAQLPAYHQRMIEREKDSMTPKAASELQELGMTEEQLAERQAKVSAMINGDANEQAAAKPVRAKRSDAGVPRKKPEAAPEPVPQGKLTCDQAARLVDLIQTKETRRTEWDSAVDHAQQCTEAYVAAGTELDDYLNEITAK